MSRRQRLPVNGQDRVEPSRSVPAAMALATVASYCLACGCVGEVRDGRSAAAESIRGAAIRQHMEVLAADAMMGREAGTEEFLVAARYVAERFREAGLRPLGGDGTYFQPIDFLESTLDPAGATLTLASGDGRRESLRLGDDFVMSGGFGAPEERVEAPLLFVGYGIVAPELRHDDFQGVDAYGKILVALSGAPPGFGTDPRAYYSSLTGKMATAVEQGAVGFLTVRTPVDQRRRPWARYLPQIRARGLRWITGDGAAHEGFPQLAGPATLSEVGAEKLFALSDRELARVFERHERGETGSFDLGVGATITRRSRQANARSVNVLGWLPGRDPDLANEIVVFTAHLDHLGSRPGEADGVLNGAYDNAAGVGVMLEVAAAMSAMRDEPGRSVLFAAVTGEEKGLQGSSYLAEHPPVAAARVVANVNVDMPFLGFPIADVEAFGAEHSSLLASVEAAAERIGLELTPDSMPEEVRFIRSDQFSFVRSGIPAVALKPGSRSSDPGLDGPAMLTDFLKNHYHQPTDDLSLPFSPEGAQRFARWALLTGLGIAADRERPRWNEGDFFGITFCSRRLPSPETEQRRERDHHPPGPGEVDR